MKFKAISLGLVSALLIVGVILYFHFPAVRAQNSSSPPPMSGQTPIPPPMPQSIYAGLWRVDHTFTANIHIKNLMVTHSVQVTPVLFMADGTEYDLSPVNLGPNAVSDIDINKALAQAPAAFRAHSSTYGSAALKYMYPAPGVVAGKIAMIDTPRSLIFTSGFEMMMNSMIPGISPSLQTVEGLWWKHDQSIDGFVDVANTTGNPMKVTLRAIGAHGLTLPAQPVTLAPHASAMLDLDELTADLPDPENQAGGVRVQWTGYMGDVTIVGGLEGDREGYSADLPFWPHNPNPSSGRKDPRTVSMGHAGSASTLTLGAVGIMAGYPDSSMGFPGATRFTPYVTLRNTTPRPMALAPALYEANGGQNQSFSLPAEVLGAYETRQVDVAGDLAKLGLGHFSGFINLTYSYSGGSGDLLMAAGSVDQTGSYVFQVLPQGINPGWAKDVPGWTVANGYDTMFALWNPSSQAEDLVAIFYYSDGSGSYQLPVHLEAHASLNIDMAQLIAHGEPDANGNTLSGGATEGSVMFSSPKGMKGTIELAVNAAEFNVTNATCGAGCICCCGVTCICICPFTALCPLNVAEQMYAYAYYTNGAKDDITTSASWSSLNTSIVSVNNSSNPGLSTGVALGDTCIDAYFVATPGGNICNCSGFCPSNENMGGRAEAFVDNLQFQITSGGAPNDPQGVIAKQAFNLKITAQNAQGTDTTLYGNVSFTLAGLNTGVGEAAPNTVYFSAGVANANVTVVQASGTENSPSSQRKISVGADASDTDFYPWVYFEESMDYEAWKNPGFTSCPNKGSYYCTTACDTNGFSQPAAFISLTDKVCHAGVTVEAQQQNGNWSSPVSTTVEDCGPPVNGQICVTPYWFTGGSYPSVGGCLSDQLASELGGENASGHSTVLWRFNQ